MIGHTHALSGAVVFLAATTALEHLEPFNPAAIALGAVTAAGAALLPDLDHTQATAARTFGPATRILARAVETISGGHRHATHSLLGAAAFTGLAVAAAAYRGWPLAILLALCIGLADRALLPRAKPRRDWKLTWGDVAGLVHAAAAAYVGWLLAFSALDMVVVPWAVTIGVLAHLIGDALTEQGIPWLYPLRRWYRMATIDTGKVVERWIVVPALYVALAAIVYATRGTWLQHLPDLNVLAGGRPWA